MKVLIDGYNLIFAWGWMPRTKNASASQQARAKMIDRLKQLIRPQDRNRVTLVFDVRGNRDVARRNLIEKVSHGFQIQFASEHPDADDLIVELIRKEPDPGNLVVVSSDLQIKTAASRRKVLVINSQDCLEQLPALFQSLPSGQSAGDNAMESEIPSGSIRQKAIEELSGIDWMKEFGLDEGNSEARGKC